MMRIRPIIACSALACLLACAEGSTVENVQPNHPANFKAVDAPAATPRGELLEATHVVSLSKAELAGKIGNLLAGFKLEAQNGVHIYRIKYQTATPASTPVPVIASGLMIVPDSKLATYPWVAVQHGTSTSKADAPSVTPGEGLFEASQGFVTLVMDYIGYGASSQVFHPYLIEKAYADAGIDFLKATYKFAKIDSIGTGPLFLKGYSEGGYATLAIQKEIETNSPGVFPLVASAPSAGPYDLDATAKELMAKPTVHPVNIPFLILSYTQWLSNQDFNPDNVFVPKTTDVASLFTGQFNNDYIGSKIPTENAKMLKAGLVADFLSAAPQSNEAVKLHSYLQAQSLTNKGWQPKAITIFYHCEDDEVVPFSSLAIARQAFPNEKNVFMAPIKSPAGNPYRHTTCPAIFAPTVKFLEILKTLPAK